MRSHTMKSLKALQTRLLFHCIGHTALKRFNDIVTTTATIVFLQWLQCFHDFIVCVWSQLNGTRLRYV